MEKPLWVKGVGVTGIVISCLGILGGVLNILNAFALNAVQFFMSPSISTSSPEETKGSIEKQIEQWSNSINEVLYVPDCFMSFLIIAGIVGILIAIFYLIASIRLLHVKVNSINMFFLALIVSILFTTIKTFVLHTSGTIYERGAVVNGGLYIFINLILLVITKVSDKKVFEDQSLS